ncbi:hypothetical protein D3C72_1927570 [compost metagenome]
MLVDIAQRFQGMDGALRRALVHAGQRGQFRQGQRTVDAVEGAQDFEAFFERLVEQRVVAVGRGWRDGF